MPDARLVIEKHLGKGVFVDTNLLVLLLVGLVNPKRIQNFKRTQDFTLDDFHLLLKLLDLFGAPLITTPHVLSQVSDLTDLSGKERALVRALFKSTIKEIDEQYDPASVLVQNPTFERFGLGDASIAAVCKRNVLVLTADLQLQVALELLGLDALNFNHVRALQW